jgi:hypothetical protein
MLRISNWDREWERENRISKANGNSLIRIIDGSLCNKDSKEFSKLFTKSYLEDISIFKKNFPTFKKTDYQTTPPVILNKHKKAFNYQQSSDIKPVILSRNIMENIAPKRDTPSNFSKSKSDNGWTKLFKFLTDES